LLSVRIFKRIAAILVLAGVAGCASDNLGALGARPELALGSLFASKSAPPSDAVTPLRGRLAKPPSGYIGFCQRFPDQCTAPADAPRQVHMTETLWHTLETLKQETETTSTHRFLSAGETGGLVDCVGCLTLTRHEACANKKREASFNLLRVDQTGRLSSAWIGFDSAITDSQKLSRLLSRVLQIEKSPSR